MHVWLAAPYMYEYVQCAFEVAVSKFSPIACLVFVLL